MAEATRWPVRILLLGVLTGPVLSLWLSDNYLVYGALLLALVAVGFFVDSRVGAMRLAVDDNSVRVVNFLSSHDLDLDTVLIESVEESSHWPAADLPRSTRSPDKGAAPIGSLYLSDASGRRVRVGVAPSFGGRMVAIVDDLKIAIARHRL